MPQIMINAYHAVKIKTYLKKKKIDTDLRYKDDVNKNNVLIKTQKIKC